VSLTDPHSQGAPRRSWLLGSIALAALVRLPFWLLAWRAPIDADTAIVGLMARHFGLSRSFWGQPYGSPLESWLVVPAVALGAGGGAVRVLYFLLSLALVPLAFALAARIHPRAALPAALVIACPPAYGFLLAAMPPPLYPASLAMGGLLLLLTLELRGRLERGERASGLAAAWGILAGLMLWTHFMSASVVLAGLLCLAPVLARRSGTSLVLVLAALGSSAPVWLAAIQGGQSLAIVKLSGPRLTWSQHLLGLLGNVHVPLSGLLGAGVPPIADLEQRLESPPWVGVPLCIAWAGLAASGAWHARSSAAGRLAIAAAIFTVVFFLVPLRSDLHTIRFLTPLYVPLAALAGAALAQTAGAGRAALVALVALQAASAVPLLEAWRRADRARAPYFTPDLEPVLRFLEENGVTRAFASYEPAYRLTLESREAILVSQPWNERFPRSRLPYLEEVRSASRVAWVLTPGIPSDLPSPDAFEAELRRSGGRWRREQAGPTAVFFDFEPPRGDVEDSGTTVSWHNGHPEWRPGRRKPPVL
jgi:hypothetical protein